MHTVTRPADIPAPPHRPPLPPPCWAVIDAFLAELATPRPF